MSSKFVEEEAALSDDSDVDSSDDDGLDDEDEIAKEGAGFIADEDDSEDEEEEAAPRKKKKRHKRALELDDEDLNLVEENTGKKIKRHNKRVFKRQEETTAPVGRDGLAREFGAGGDEYQGLEDFDDEHITGRGEPWGRDGPEGSYDDEGGEMDDFIEHDGETNDEQFRAHRRALTKTARAQGISVEAAEEFLEIFGQDAETQRKLEVWYNANEIDHGMEGIAEDEDDDVGRPAVDPMLISKYHLSQKDDEIRDANMPERLFVEVQNDAIPHFHADDAANYVYDALVGPNAQWCIAKEILEEGFMEVEGIEGESVEDMMTKYLDMDEDVLRHEFLNHETGCVEGTGGFRLLRMRRQKEAPDSQPLPPWMGVQGWRNHPPAQDHLRECIKTAIKLLFVESLEVPVLAMYYKEALGELLAMRVHDAPGLLPREKAEELVKDKVQYLTGAVVAEGRHVRMWDILWTIYNKAFEYFELAKQQKEKIQHVEQDCQEGAREAYKQQFMHAATIDELNEWYQYFRMLNKGEKNQDDDYVTQKKPKRASKYQELASAGMHNFAAKLAVNTDEFAKSVGTITKNYRGVVEAPDPDAAIPDPENEADIHLSARQDGTPTEAQVQRCLSSTQFFLIKEIRMHPVVRAKVREIVQRIAVVNTEPTEAGDQILTPFHKYGTVKRIRDKPVEKILRINVDPEEEEHLGPGEQFLYMVAAEKEGLIKLSVDVPDEELHTELTTILTSMYTVGIDPDIHSSLYNFRSQIIERVLKDDLVPMALNAAREEMLKKAQQSVMDICCDELWIELTTPPLQLKAIDDEDIVTGDNMEVVRGQRICVVCWGDKDRGRLENSTVMVMLDARGYPSDVLTLPQFSGPIPASPPHLGTFYDDARKAEDAAAIVAFLQKHWPHLIVVGTASMACWQLQEDIKKICEDEITQDKRNENLTPLKNFTVRLVDDKLASIYESCSFAKSDLKDYPRLVRRAVALGRHCIEPLALLSGLMTQKEDPELLALPVHPLQGLVPKATRSRAYEQLLITAVSQEGVCVNSLVQKEWLAPMLQFVPGLGPRKAQALLKGIKSLPENDDYMYGTVPSQTVVSRDHLLASDADPELQDEEDQWKAIRLLQRKVYANAAPYLRITDPNELHERNEEIFQMKDNMRVHPRDEDALLRISCAALDMPDSAAAEDPIPQAVAAPNKVMQVDIGMFDADWRDRNASSQSRISTFADLAFELVRPYGSVRAPERLDLTEEQCFWALTGEDRFLLRPGKLVSARVLWVKKDLAGLVTDNGINCHLSRANVKSVEPQSLEQVLQKGMEIQARVYRLDFSNGGRLVLISKSEELAKHTVWEHEYLKNGDKYYHVIEQKERLAMEKAKREKLKLQKASKILHRPINHRRFVNLPSNRVEQALKNPDWNNVDKLRRIPGVDPKGAKDGDFLFYPSQKGSDRIVACIRLFKRDNTVPVFQHIDFMETKSHKGAGNNLALGTPLKLQHFPFLNEDETQFEDLDDLGVNFVKKYVAMFDEILKSNKFASGDRVRVNNELNEAFMGSPTYRLCLGFHPEKHAPEGQHPVGWGTLALKLSHNAEPIHYPFRICHKGYFGTFRQGVKSTLHSSVNSLINAMKTTMKQRAQEEKEVHDARRKAAEQRQQQPYGAYPQMPPSGGYQGHYGPHMGGYGGGQAGFVAQGRGF